MPSDDASVLAALTNPIQALAFAGIQWRPVLRMFRLGLPLCDDSR
jgi:hypothetical protein